MNKPYILVLGVNGMAGHMIANYLKSNDYNVKTSSRMYYSDIILDIEKDDITFLKDYNFTHIINCIGLLPKDCENNLDKAININTTFPKRLSLLFAHTKTKIIHLSTDCVFNGKEKRLYYPYDIKNAEDYYGLSKSNGELNNNKDLTIRTSIIGPEIKQNPSGLFEWLHNNDNINGWTNAFWNGVTTLELAKAIEMSLFRNDTGIVHLSSNVFISKYGLLQLLNTIFFDDKKTISPILLEQSISKILVPSNDFYVVQSYETMLKELLGYMIAHNYLNFEGKIP